MTSLPTIARAAQPGPVSPTGSEPVRGEDEVAWANAQKTRRYSMPASSAAATAVGMLGGVVVASILSVALRGKLNGSFLGRAALAGGAFGGLGFAANVVTGGGVGNTLLVLTHGQRHQIGFALSNLDRPWLATDARAAYRDARELQAERYGNEAEIDNGIDALRHGYGAGRLAAMLVIDRKMGAEDAQRAVEEIGHAHEMDGIDNNGLSEQMDEHNNRVGAQLGIELAAELDRMPTREELATVVGDSIARGDLLVVDDEALRASRPADLPEPR